MSYLILIAAFIIIYVIMIIIPNVHRMNRNEKEIFEDAMKKADRNIDKSKDIL